MTPFTLSQQPQQQLSCRGLTHQSTSYSTRTTPSRSSPQPVTSRPESSLHSSDGGILAADGYSQCCYRPRVTQLGYQAKSHATYHQQEDRPQASGQQPMPTNSIYRAAHRPRFSSAALGGTPPPTNRTFYNKFFKVDRSMLGGYGIFATTDIDQGTNILVEEPLVYLERHSELYKEYAKLKDQGKRAVFDGLVGYHNKHTDPIYRRWSANHFLLPSGHSGIFAIASNFNHACRSRRNTRYSWDPERGAMVFRTTRAVKAGDEMVISYGQERQMLYKLYGFVCRCGGCDHQAWKTDPTLQY